MTSIHIHYISSVCRGFPNFANKIFANVHFRQWRKSTVLSPMHLIESRRLAKVHCTFVNIFIGNSPMSLWNYMCVKRASSNYTKEFKLWYSYSNDINFISHMYSILILVYHSWRESTVLSPIHLMESRRLAKVQWTFVNILPNFRQWRMSCWRKSYWRRAGKPA